MCQSTSKLWPPRLDGIKIFAIMSPYGLAKKKEKKDAQAIYYSSCSWFRIYATSAAGGMMYSMSVFFLARQYRLITANIFMPSSLGGHKLLVYWRKIFIWKFYTVGSLNSCQFWRVSFKKLRKLTNFGPKLPYIESDFGKN